MDKSSLWEFKTLLPYLSRYKWQYILGFTCLLTVDAAQVIIPQFMRQAVDVISEGNFSLQRVVVSAAAMVGLMTTVSLGRFLWRYFIHGSSRRIETEMRKNLFEHLLSLSYDFYQQNKIGDLMARATSDVNTVRESIGMGLVVLIDGTVMAAAILVIIFVQDAKTAAFAVLPLPVITIIILRFGSLVGKRFQRVQECYSAMSNMVQETFAGIRVIKSFVKEWWFIEKFADTNDDYRDANMLLVKLFGFFFPFISFLSGLTILIVLLAGGIQVIQGNMTPGGLVAMFSYLRMLIWPLMGAGFMVNMIQRGAVSLGRINRIMRTLPAIVSPLSAGAASLDPSLPLIEIKNLSFTYPNGSEVLRDISLSIKAGSVTGIIGRTGSGKSTLIKAMIRMIEAPAGTVFIKGLEAASWNLEELRKLYGVTPQDSYLFSDSLKNNIAYGLENPLDEKLKNAASVSAIEKDLAEFSGGWDTLIGERGLTLSGGQKQRTAMARSLAVEREILVLDDSFSAVDAETERRILDSLMSLKNSAGNLTIIIVSHRVSTLSRCDTVFVLDSGRVTESGTPEKLLKSGGFFAHTAALQRLGEGETGETGGVARG
ncbi:MAG: ABC transporter ATP-binding protein/permease [Treponema sp.]|jgi:ATP-binding cassette subfamily B protein|nr:ABC transporter ATP-binding protein/permease [Treponema sp.]